MKNVARHGCRTQATQLLVACLLAGGPVAASAAEIVHADGRRETVAEPRQDSKGAWTAEMEGRRVILRPGEVVAVIDDAGVETVTIPAMADPPDAPGTPALLASLRDPKNEAWRDAAGRLSARPTKALLDALAALAADAKKEIRIRAITALAGLRTREGVVAAATAVFAEKDAAPRREAASVLFSVEEIFRRAPTEELLRSGLLDKDAMVRFIFAMLAPRSLADAVAVLRKDGLAHDDHHVRESAALELGLRGDGSGESLLLSMLARAKVPGIDDAALSERLTIAEKVQICAALGKIATDSAKAALRKAATSPHEAIRKAAEKALAAAK